MLNFRDRSVSAGVVCICPFPDGLPVIGVILQLQLGEIADKLVPFLLGKSIHCDFQ